MTASLPVTWILTDGTVGMEVQCAGLAAAVGVTSETRRIRPSALLRLLPGLGRLGLLPPAAGGDRLAPPWPDLLISCGRRTAGAAIWVRSRARGRCLAVHIQDPRLDPALFDLLVVPEHDPTRGPNVVVTRGALNRLNPADLAREGARVSASVARLPRPLVAVNVGGSNKRYDFAAGRVRAFAAALAGFAERHGAGLMVATSRRTDAATRRILAETLPPDRAVVWTGEGANPYLGYLALAEALIVTSDSVNMVSEACSTGRPVYIASLEPEAGRLAAFHARLQADGLTRPFDGPLDHWDYTPLDETARVAAILRERLVARGFVDLSRPPA
jgi:uncharacterized protein